MRTTAGIIKRETGIGGMLILPKRKQKIVITKWSIEFDQEFTPFQRTQEDVEELIPGMKSWEGFLFVHTKNVGILINCEQVRGIFLNLTKNYIAQGIILFTEVMLLERKKYTKIMFTGTGKIKESIK